MTSYILQFFLGAVFLFYGSEYLITGSKKIANRFKVKPIIIGITLVALGTSLPELIVSVLANLKHQQGMVIGNVMGSNIANIGLVLGMTAIFRVIRYPFKKIYYDMYFLIAITILPVLFLFFENLIIWHGLLFIGLLIIYILYLNNSNKLGHGENNDVFNKGGFSLTLRVIFGIIGLILGSTLFVEGAIGLAILLGISDLVIGMSIVALGTSLPELITSLTAARHGETDFIIGNIIGSNIMNICLVLGTSILFGSIHIEFNQIIPHTLFILILTFGLFFMLKRYNTITKFSGSILVAIYILFLYVNFQTI